MRRVMLTNEIFALVDDEDFDSICNYRWHYRKNGNTKYATTRFRVDGKIVDIDMHRAIMGINDPNILIDHKDGNGLNNYKSNLRPCNRSENASNRHHPKNGKKCTSKYFGVALMPENRKWRAYITKDGKQISLGIHFKEDDAAKAYNNAALKYHGEFAKLNQI